MKKCTYCGKEYPDDVARCTIDQEPLTPEPLTAGKITGSELQKGPPETVFAKNVLSERHMLAFEILIVCAVAFSSSILTAGHYLFSRGSYASLPRTGYSWTSQILHELTCLCLLWYVLKRRGNGFSNLGLSWSWRDAGWSIILVLAGGIAFKAVYSLLFLTGVTIVDLGTAQHNVGHLLFGGGVFLVTILFQFVNPFFEELIVRAYVMTGVKYLTNNMAKAIIISTVLQTSYHFYQGVPMAFSDGATFLIFSLYYAKTNRIAPVILAHLYMDVSGTFSYWFHH